MAGIEIVSDRASKSPAADWARATVNHMRELRILISTEGPRQNVLKILPPMPFAPTHVDLLVDGLNQAIGKVAAKGTRS
jgi:4-aminobutyrate aminotransferase-like enzyme